MVKYIIESHEDFIHCTGKGKLIKRDYLTFVCIIFFTELVIGFIPIRGYKQCDKFNEFFNTAIYNNRKILTILYFKMFFFCLLFSSLFSLKIKPSMSWFIFQLCKFPPFKHFFFKIIYFMLIVFRAIFLTIVVFFFTKGNSYLLGLNMPICFSLLFTLFGTSFILLFF